MNAKHAHKDKERLRHHKQIQLLDEVMKIVPKVPDGSETRVRKLRRLVLYYHFMRMACAEITGKCFKGPCRPQKKKRKRITKPVYEPLKVQPEMKKTRRKANIVFLEVDRSVDSKSILKQSALKKNNTAVTLYNNEESTLATKLEYEVPEIELTRNVANSAVQEMTFSPGNSNLFEMNVNNSVSTADCETSPASFMNHYSDLYCSAEPIKQSEYWLHNGNEICSPVESDCLVISHVGEMETSLLNMENLPKAVIVNDTNLGSSRLRGNGLNSISQNYSDYSFLKNFCDSTCKNLRTSNASVSIENEECVSSYGQVYTCVANSGSPMSVSSREYQNSILTGNDLYYKPDFYIHSKYIKPQFYSCASTFGNVSDSCSSTDNLHINIENVSNCSNSPLSNFVQYSRTVNEGNNVDMPMYPVCDNIQLSAHEFLRPPGCEGIKKEYVVPVLSCDNYVENIPQQNEASYTSEDMLRLHNKHIYSNNCNNHAVAFPFESAHSYDGTVIKTRYLDEDDSFYCQSLGHNNRPEDLLLKQPVLGIVSANCFPESIPGGYVPALFEEEASYSLSQYIDNR